MSTPLVVCPGCSRHVFSSEQACPFCRAPRAGSIAAVALVAAAVLAGATAHADPPSPRLDMPFAGAQGYGAPPDRPWERVGQEVTPERPAEAPSGRVVVAVARGPMRVIAPRVQRALVQRMASFGWCPVAPWGVARVTVRAVVGDDGALHVAGVTGATGAVRACVSERLEGVRVAGAGRVVGAVRFDVQLRAAAGVGASRCGASPVGCARTGCEAGLVCDRSVRCVPSSCGCDPQTGQWTCTSDCGGGVCVPPGARRLR